MIDKQLLKDSLGWGWILWFIGWILGFIFFFLVKPTFVVWAIMPIMLVVTLWVLFKKIKGDSLKYYLIVAISWTIIAILFDYVFNVLAFNLGDRFYTIDIYIYYLLAFVSPLFVYWWKKKIQ